MWSSKSMIIILWYIFYSTYYYERAVENTEWWAEIPLFSRRALVLYLPVAVWWAYRLSDGFLVPASNFQIDEMLFIAS